MSYSDADRRSYSFPAVAFGSSSSQHIRGPLGKSGRLVCIHLSATVLFTAVTTPAHIKVGSDTDDDSHADYALSTNAAGSAVSTDDGVSDTDAIIDPNIPADELVKVSFVAPTGGSPAGTGTVHIEIDWAW